MNPYAPAGKSNHLCTRRTTQILKIIILTDGIYPFVIGGMQKHSYYLTKLLAQKGMDVTLFHCVTNGKVPSEDEVRAKLDIPQDAKFSVKGFRFPQMMRLPGHYLRASFAYSTILLDELKEDLDTYDLIYSKGFAAWALLNKKRKGMKTPPVSVKFHGYEMFQPPPSFKAKLQNYLLKGPVEFNNKYADHIFSYGGKITQIISSLGVDASKIIDIPSGIEEKWLRETITPTQKPLRFLFLGRYERRKGIEELNQVLENQPATAEFKFDFVGPIPGSKMVKDDRITYHGKIMDAEKLQAVMDQCDVLVTPSHSEGMPNVIMEGMARGLAVIATDVGAVPLQVDDQNGWRIEPGNSEALGATFTKVLASSTEELDQKKKNSLKRIRERFLWDTVCDEHIKAFKQIVGN